MLPLWRQSDLGVGVSYHSIGVYEFPMMAKAPFIPVYLASVYKIFGDEGGVVTRVGTSIHLEPYLGVGFRLNGFEFGMNFGLLDRFVQAYETDTSSKWRIPHYVPYGDYYLSYRIPLFTSEDPLLRDSGGMAAGLTWTAITTGGLFYFVGAMLLNIL